MATEYENQEKVAALPQEGVHCFAASSRQITIRRIVTTILFVAFAAGACFFFMRDGGLGLGIFCAIAALICVMVFIQTFLIADYRVAVDYNMKEIVLRYRFSKVKIPFENLDSRDGEPSKAEAMLDSTGVGNKQKTFYLVFDDVYEDVCFQTSTNDLASREDFFKLKEEAFAIADAYGARNSEGAIKPQFSGKGADSEIDEIVKNAIEDDSDN